MLLKKIFLGTILSLLLINGFAQTEKAQIYKVVVSFGSFAEGVPSAQPLLDFIQQFKKEQKLTCICADHIGPLGREGEYKLAFALTDWSKKKIEKFIKGVTQVATRMNERGQATVTTNETISPTDIPSRATIVQEVY